MIKKVARYLSLYRIFVIQYVKTMMQSKVDFFIGLGGFLISQAAGLAFCILFLNRYPPCKNGI